MNRAKLSSPYLAVAPMLDWTDRHCRYFHRLFTKKTALYTEMVTTGALIHGKQDFIQYHPAEQPVVLQLGGSDPAAMAECTARAAERGYQEVNINVGCPSDRVQNGSFGACLMATPETVAECVAAMRAAAPVRISVKTRLGIDEHDSDSFLQGFIETVAAAGCEHFTLHARTAWLKGLSPKQNREIPPLNYERVYRMKDRYPQLHVTVNGGITSVSDIAQHLQHVDGVMIGREAYQNPAFLSQFDPFFEGESGTITDEEAVRLMIPYINQHVAAGGRCWHVVRHMLGLFQGAPGAKRWRQVLSQRGPSATDASELLEQALAEISIARSKYAENVANFTTPTS
ncbi:tRNA dihydrouridine(20/20a) synthase DusA [Pseudidiomarina sp.]|uniref:tRNA dihydrouridine(20/20a) synthase DusA n=1 Tax=Pseudidiomarina sp. TaxID=2081707 RepID=UPI00299D7E63|nr:tRNA dihydrouridine(20/20a) synthase DusA [Pseudidiomarina sp.]MDX1706076.1 tRNA dihydrouridine(20/20a) synthase DusA [Pseudidiomarina sp.]